jgi:hypothetical protein
MNGRWKCPPRLAPLVPVLAALLVLVVIATGCGSSPNPQAVKLIQDSNVHLKKAAEDIKGLGTFNQQFQALLSGQANLAMAVKVQALLEKAQVSEKQSLEQIRIARTSMSKIRDLPVSAEMKTYVDMKLAALDGQEQVLVVELQAMDLRLKAIKDLEAGATLESLLALEKQIQVLEQKSIEDARDASDLHKKANAYFEEKKLGK